MIINGSDKNVCSDTGLSEEFLNFDLLLFSFATYPRSWDSLMHSARLQGISCLYLVSIELANYVKSILMTASINQAWFYVFTFFFLLNNSGGSHLDQLVLLFSDRILRGRARD